MTRYNCIRNTFWNLIICICYININLRVISQAFSPSFLSTLKEPTNLQIIRLFTPFEECFVNFWADDFSENVDLSKLKSERVVSDLLQFIRVLSKDNSILGQFLQIMKS